MNPNLEYIRFDTRASLDAWIAAHHWFSPLEVVGWGGHFYLAVNWRRNV